MEDKKVKNEMKTTDQIVVTKKDTILIEKQAAPEKREHLVIYNELIRR